jgi:autotransporter-associated beta strand protein
MAAAVAAMLGPALAAPAYDLHFDYTSFESTFGQSQFDVLNYPSINGNYMMTSTDNHRPEMVANGNKLAEFYNWLQQRYEAHSTKNGLVSAAEIDAYVVNNSTHNGPKPDWLILNEISSSLWSANPGSPSISVYRTWLLDCVTSLRDDYGYNVVALAPFQNPGANDASWQALSQVAYVGIECYLSGTEVWNSGADSTSRFNWARSQYQASKNSYMNRGVPANRLFVTEHFANNNATYVDNQGVTRTTGWGRAGLANAADWDTVIQIRQDAILAAGFDGFLAYNWGGNAMGVTQAEQIQHEYYYRTRRVLATQQPQWLSDNAINVNGTVIPLSWSQPLNWLGGVPNTSGAVANFWRTLKASRAITLDGNKTIGRLTFDSPYSYTISPGTGGSLIFNDSGSTATLVSSQGNHTISTAVQLSDNLSAAINAGTFTISGNVSGAGGLVKSGVGTLSLNGTNSYAGDTTVQAGRLRINSRFLADTADVLLSTGGTLELQFSGSPDVISSLLINGVVQSAGTWGAVGSGAQHTTALILGSGWLLATAGSLAGDFNGDGMVDAADYAVWRKGLGTIYTQDDYDDWRANFGQSAGSGAVQNDPAPAAVPEPAGCVLTMLAALLGIAAQRRA